jgi:hypothetical protein
VVVNTYDTDSEDETTTPHKTKNEYSKIKSPIVNAIFMYENNKSTSKEGDKNSLVTS